MKRLAFIAFIIGIVAAPALAYFYAPNSQWYQWRQCSDGQVPMPTNGYTKKPLATWEWDKIMDHIEDCPDGQVPWYYVLNSCTGDMEKWQPVLVLGAWKTVRKPANWQPGSGNSDCRITIYPTTWDECGCP